MITRKQLALTWMECQRLDEAEEVFPWEYPILCEPEMNEAAYVVGNLDMNDSDPVPLQEALIQVAAVALQWHAAINRWKKNERGE